MLDVGAGTGLLAQHIQSATRHLIDALDISTQMLAVAASKDLYRTTIEADLTAPLPLPDGVYGAVVSSGTFTHGHVGPDALDEILRVARPGAFFALSVNATHFEARGFAAKFEALAAAITGFTLHTVPIYGGGSDADAAAAHGHDKGHIAVFRKR